MSEKRTLLSRPRTRVYDCNYNIGEKYYKPMVDQLDRKYSGRGPLPTFSSSPIITNRSSIDDDLPSTRRVFGGPSSSSNNDFESISDRRSRLSDNSRSLEDDLEEDILSSMRRLKAIRAAKASSVDDDFSSTFSNGIQRKKTLTDKLLDTVGINGKMQDALESEILKKRTTKIPSVFDDEPSFTRWSSVRDASFTEDSVGESSAKARARKSRARLADIENEIEAVAERGAAREKRLSNLRSLISGEDPFLETDSFKSRSKTLKKVTF